MSNDLRSWFVTFPNGVIPLVENWGCDSEPTRVTARCFDEECKWRIHASVMQDQITFETLIEPHSCTRCYKDANKVVTQGWIASVVKDMVRSDGNVSAIELQKWVKKKYNIDVPYIKVYRGKEQAYNDMHGKWEDSFMKTNAFKEELLRRNLGSIVEVDFESKGNKWEDSFMKTNAFKEELPSMNDC